MKVFRHALAWILAGPLLLAVGAQMLAEKTKDKLLRTVERLYP